MKILHTSDWHLGKKLDGFERNEEQKKFLSDLLNIVENNDIDILIVAGDIYDSSNPTIEAEKMYYDFIKKMGDMKKCNIIIISGNHDSPKRLLRTRNIEKDFGVIIFSNPEEKIQIGEYGVGKVLSSNKGCFEIEVHGKKAFISCLPYISDIEAETIVKNSLADEDLSNEEFNKKRQEISKLSYGEKINMIFKSREKYRDKSMPYIAITHLFVSNVEGDKEEGAFDFGGSYTIKLDHLPKADYVAMGHVHKPQRFKKYNAFYCGSPIEYRISENKFTKKIFIADIEVIENESKLQFDEIDISNYKPIVKYECSSIEEGIKISEERRNENEWIYLEINSDRTLYASEVKKIKENKNVVDIFLNISGKDYESSEIIDDNMEKDITSAFINYYKFQNNSFDIEPKKEVVELFNKLILDDSREVDE